MRVEIAPSPDLEDRRLDPSRTLRAHSSGDRDAEEEHLRFILQSQRHCDHFLRHIADPAGKSVLVLGAGTGAEILWCLRHGAREVVGIDRAPRDDSALRRAVLHTGVDPGLPFEMHRLALEDAPQLDRRFDLVLANNVFGHSPGLGRALEVCTELLEPDRGRLAVFTDPLFYSSSGSQLPLEPWEHIWGEKEAMRRLLLEQCLAAEPALRGSDVRFFLERELGRDKMRLSSFLDAVRDAGLILLNLRLERDRNLIVLPEYYRRMVEVLGEEATPAVMDLALEGIYAELALPDLRAEDREIDDETTDLGLVLPILISTEERLRQRDRDALVEQIHSLGASLQEVRQHSEDERRRKLLALSERDDERRERQYWQQTARRLREILDEMETSSSFRAGRVLTAPWRWLRGLFRAP